MRLAALQAAAPDTRDQAKVRDAATQLESILVKQLLTSSGAFKGSEAAGSSLTHDLFADSLAQAVAKAGGLGLAALLTRDGAEPQGDLGRVTSGFGARVDPITGKPSNHTGVDLPASEGTPIPAAKDGIVIAAGPRGGYGNAVEIAHPDGSTTLYAHANEVLVTPGMSVHTGEAIATVGQTGRTTGPHLHLEVREGGHPVNPGRALKSYRLRDEGASGGCP